MSEEAIVASDKRHISIPRRSRKQIMGSLTIAKDDLVMEIGSGNRPFPRSDILCDKYLAYTPARGEEIAIDRRPFIACDAQQLPFKDKSFDYIIACQILEYIDNPDKFLKELMRVGKKGYIEVTSEIREVLFDWDARKYVGSIDGQGKLVIRRKIGRGPFGSVFRQIQDYRLNAFIHDNWSVFNYSLEWVGRIDYVVDEKGIAVTELQKELEIELSSNNKETQREKYMDLLRAIWAITPSFVRQIAKSVRKAIKSGSQRRVMSLEELLRIMACPVCKGSIYIDKQKNAIVCTSCQQLYPLVQKGGKKIPVMLVDEEVEER